MPYTSLPMTLLAAMPLPSTMSPSATGQTSPSSRSHPLLPLSHFLPCFGCWQRPPHAVSCASCCTHAHVLIHGHVACMLKHATMLLLVCCAVLCCAVLCCTMLLLLLLVYCAKLLVYCAVLIPNCMRFLMTQCISSAGCLFSSASRDQLCIGGHQWQRQIHCTQAALQVCHSSQYPVLKIVFC